LAWPAGLGRLILICGQARIGDIRDDLQPSAAERAEGDVDVEGAF
jgi:hypothetical protein